VSSGDKCVCVLKVADYKKVLKVHFLKPKLVHYSNADLWYVFLYIAAYLV